MISGSISCDGPGSLSPLPGRSDFLVHFFSSVGATAAGTGWFWGSATVPAAGAGATAMPAGEAGQEMTAVLHANTSPVL